MSEENSSNGLDSITGLFKFVFLMIVGVIILGFCSDFLKRVNEEYECEIKITFKDGGIEYVKKYEDKGFGEADVILCHENEKTIINTNNIESVEKVKR